MGVPSARAPTIIVAIILTVPPSPVATLTMLWPLIRRPWFIVVAMLRSEFVPRMKQRRQILIGARDPVTQKQKVCS